MDRTRALVAGILAAAACGAPRLPTPEYAQQPSSALAEVAFPPPPARVEIVPEQPRKGTVWVDGEWLWQARRWAWKPGRWVVPPAGARFSPWTAVRDRTGTLYVATGVWRNARGAEVEEPPPVLAGSPSPTAIVSPEGDQLPRGPTVPLDAGPSSPPPGEPPADAGADAGPDPDAAAPSDAGPPGEGGA